MIASIGCRNILRQRRPSILLNNARYIQRHFSSAPPSNENQKHRSQRNLLIKHWFEQIQSPPNIITSLRILSAPYLSFLIISGQNETALVGCFLAGLSDVLDGHIARQYNMTTVLGTYLDPFADKIMINGLALSLGYVEILPAPLVMLWLARDVGLSVGTYWLVKSTKKEGEYTIDPGMTALKVEPSTISKVNTGLQFLTLGAGLIQPLYGVPPEVLEGLWCVFEL